MYEAFFGFTEKPFSLTPDTQFFFAQQSHRQAFNTLLLALHHSEGFIKVVGEVGTGKTLVCRKLLAALSADCVTCYIPNPYLTPAELKAQVAADIGAPVQADMPAHQLMTVITQRLLSLAAANRQVILIIDEAQAMPRETLEALRLLTNLETEKRKLLQVVLFGQPELDVLLARPDLRQLRQRIVFAETLRPLTLGEVIGYLRFRLTKAGASADLISYPAALFIALASAGVPRLINILAHKSLLSGYGEGASTITCTHVARAVMDTGDSHRIGRWLAWRWRLLLPVSAGLAALAVLLFPVWQSHWPGLLGLLS